MNIQNTSIARAMNSITLVGNVGQDPITKTLTNGSNVLMFSLATSENRKIDKNKDVAEKTITEWHPIRVYCDNNSLPSLMNTIKKGVKLYIEGSMNYFSYVDTSGNKNYSFYVEASHISLGLLKKRPVDLYNIIKLSGTVHGATTEAREAKDPKPDEMDRSYILVRFKLRTVKEFQAEDGTVKTYNNDHNVRGIINPSAMPDAKKYLEDGARVMVIAKMRYLHIDNNLETGKKQNKIAIADMSDMFVDIFDTVPKKVSIGEINKEYIKEDNDMMDDVEEELPF